jgi:hypothetical protein
MRWAGGSRARAGGVAAAATASWVLGCAATAEVSARGARRARRRVALSEMLVGRGGAAVRRRSAGVREMRGRRRPVPLVLARRQDLWR